MSIYTKLCLLQATLEGVFEVMDDSVDSVGVSESKHHLFYYNPCQ